MSSCSGSSSHTFASDSCPPFTRSRVRHLPNDQDAGHLRATGQSAASVLLASEDSQIGVRMRVCLYGQDRTHRSSSRRSGAACETGERSQHAAEERVAVADLSFWRRGGLRGRGGEEGGQERAHPAPLAATVRGQGGGGGV